MKSAIFAIGALCALFLNNSVFSQATHDATVMGVIPLGNLDYAVIIDNVSSEHYKTSVYNRGELAVNQTVDLEFTAEESTQVRVIANSLTANLYAERIVQNDTPGSNAVLQYVYPKLENGILFFESKEHISTVYDMCTDFTEYGDIDEQLDLLEAEYIGYVSFRTMIVNKYDWLHGRLTRQELDDLYAEDFIHDEIKKTLLNEHKMIGIGDSVYYFHDLGEIYRTHKENTSLLGLFEDIEREEEPLDPASPTFQHILEIDLIDGETEGQTRGAISVETNSEDSCWYVTRLNYATTPECDPFTKGFQIYIVEYFEPAGGVRDSIMFYPGVLSLEVDWGDATLNETFSSYNYTFISHSYLEFGEYQPQTTITFFDRYGNEQTIEDGADIEGGIPIEFQVESSCGKNDAVTSSSGYDGKYHVIGWTWINKNILGNHVGSATHLYESSDDGYFELVKGTLFTDIDAKFYNSLCNYKDSKYGDKLRKRRRKIQKTKTKLFPKYRFDEENGVKSKHWFVKSGYFKELNNLLSPCP